MANAAPTSAVSPGQRAKLDAYYQANPPVRIPPSPLLINPNRNRLIEEQREELSRLKNTYWQGQKLAPGTFDGWLSSSNGVVTKYPTMQAAIAAGGDYYEPNFIRQPQLPQIPGR
jgi:hypothetical protein